MDVDTSSGRPGCLTFDMVIELSRFKLVKDKTYEDVFYRMSAISLTPRLQGGSVGADEVAGNSLEFCSDYYFTLLINVFGSRRISQRSATNTLPPSIKRISFVWGLITKLRYTCFFL